MAALALAADAIVGGMSGHHAILPIGLRGIGVIAFYVMTLFAYRLREGLEQAELLLAELHETREAQAQAAALADLARAGLEEARRAIGMLRDDELPGPERLEALARDLERDAGVLCLLEVSGE